jgi:hypothetical protein
LGAASRGGGDLYGGLGVSMPWLGEDGE